jgi:hypothetical protein
LSVAGTLGPPLTVTTSLMFYFGWARSDTQARSMSLDVTLFGFTTQDYVMRSVSTLYIPLLVTVSIALGLAGAASSRPWLLSSGVRRDAVHKAGQVGLITGLAGRRRRVGGRGDEQQHRPAGASLGGLQP